MSFQAPVEEIAFTLTHVANMPSVSALPDFEEATPDLIEAALREAGRLAEEMLAPLNGVGDRQGARLENGVVRMPDGWDAAWRAYVEGGWTSVPFDPDFGGQGLPFVVATAIQESFHAANLAFGLCPLLTQGGIELLQVHGTPEQKATYLPPLISGEWSATMNLTEPQAGSDLSRIRTRAEPEGDRYRIRGQKIFITFGEHELTGNIVHLVLARLPDAPQGSRGISLFLVPKYLPDDGGAPGRRNDLRCVSLEHKLGIHASPTAVMSFGEDDGAVGYLVGEENGGLAAMFTMMNNARLSVGLQGVAIAERAYQQALAFARERIQSRAIGGGPEAVAIIEHPDVKRMLFSMQARIQAMRGICYESAAALDMAGHHPDAEAREAAAGRLAVLTPICKSWCTDQAVDIASVGIQVHGGMGFIEETGAAQHLRDARITPIYEGTNGIQANDLVSRKIRRDGGAAVMTLIQDYRAVAEAMQAASGDHGLPALGASLGEALGRLAAATDWLVGEADELTAAAAATPYLNACGTIFGAVMHGRAALAAATMLEGGPAVQALALERLATARFYNGSILPQAGAHLAAVRDGASVLDRQAFTR